ncbi:ABC transporter permease [Romboutsia sp.]|uniref:ABC transporter permease n=1 Tax=Romboutsia sp. TaxID=1965302 RepID=UPI002C21D61F|nr:ABC transporter permease [Romboutsia sp.]HSQ88714.1 ABC transporter permease [Romboutsia sp.]
MKNYIKNLSKFEKRVLGVSFAILSMFILIAIFAQVLSPYNPYEKVNLPFLKPSSSHLLGTNDIGQDILSEVIYGTRISLLIGFISSIISIVIAVVLGLRAGYYGGKSEDIIMRITDFFLVIPFLPLVILLSVFFRGSYIGISLIIGLTYWPSSVRILRSQVIKIKNKDYILNIKSMGASDFYILRKYILKEIFPIVVYRFMFLIKGSIITESSLSFLGLGNPTIKSWGSILYYAQSRNVFLTDAWIWWIVPTGLCICILSMSFVLIGYIVENSLSPKKEVA